MPASARKEIVNPDEVEVFHCISRCVRRAFLCGEDEYSGKNYDHRKQWIEELLQYMARYFALDILDVAIMSNHFHDKLRTRPDLVKRFSDREVARRWLSLYPRRRDENDQPCPPSDEEIRQLARDKQRINELRQRLSSLSWFHAYLKEKIARRGNAEDQVTGAFWEGRFRSTKIADDAASLACSIYIDLNPIRAQIARTPEESQYTGAWYRIRARQARKIARKKAGGKRRSGSQATMNDQDADCWLAPVYERQLPADQRYAENGYRASDKSGLPMSLDQYLELLDWTGRQLRQGKRGTIPPHLADILQRLDVQAENWLEGIENFGKWFGRVAGSVQSLLAEAEKAGRRWFHGLGRSRQLFRPPD